MLLQLHKQYNRKPSQKRLFNNRKYKQNFTGRFEKTNSPQQKPNISQKVIWSHTKFYGIMPHRHIFCSLIGKPFMLYIFKWQWGVYRKYQSPHPDGGIDIFLLQKSRILDPWNYEIGLHADVSAWGCNNEILWLDLPIPVGTCT